MIFGIFFFRKRCMRVELCIHINGSIISLLVELVPHYNLGSPKLLSVLIIQTSIQFHSVLY